MSEVSPAELIERALAEASRRVGVRDAQVLVRDEVTTNLRWAMNDLTGNGVTSSRSVTVALAVELPDAAAAGTALGQGILTRAGVGPDGLAGLVDAALAAARHAGPAEDQSALLAFEELPSPDDFAAEAPEVGPQVLARLATDLGEVARRARAEQREAFGFARHEQVTTWLGTSTGLRRRFVDPRGTVEVTSMSHGRSRSAWAGRSTSDFAEVDLATMDADVARRLQWQARHEDVPAGRYRVVLPPEAVADLMTYVYFSADARSAHEGRTVFSDPAGGTRVGQRVSDVPVDLTSDPAFPGITCAPFVATTRNDAFASLRDNGLPIGASTWIERGVLRSLPTTRYTAAVTGLPLVPAPDNLMLGVPGATGEVEDLVRGVDDGLLLTCLWYVREVDPQTLLLTGLTRDGVYRVRDGEVVAAVNNFRFNESPVDLLGRIEAASTTRPALSREWNEYFDRCSMPGLVVRDFNMSSVSEAS